MTHQLNTENHDEIPRNLNAIVPLPVGMLQRHGKAALDSTITTCADEDCVNIKKARSRVVNALRAENLHE